MDCREIRVLRARAETGELREALVEDLAMPLRSRPDLPGRGSAAAATASPPYFLLTSGIVRGDGHLADLLAVEPVRAADGRDSFRDPVQGQPMGDEIGEGVLARLDQRPAGHEVGVSAPQTATSVICLWTM